MTVVAIMAGGRSERMRASGCAMHKALVPVSGMSLLERNLRRVVGLGFGHVVVAYNARERELGAHVAGLGRELAARLGARLEGFEETEHLGTIGAALALTRSGEDVLGLFVDNLTAIDLQGLVARHRLSRAPVTLATHVEPFRIPFGEVGARDGWITGYDEKSTREIAICSGVFVVGEGARRFAASSGRTDLPKLVNDVLAAGEPVAEFRHQAAWIDVNDAGALARAEIMLEERPDLFD